MRTYIIFLLLGLFVFSSCKWNNKDDFEYVEIIDQDYELYKPAKDCKATIILFGGFGESAKDIRREFKILELAKEKNLAVVLTNYKSRLWLEESEKYQLATNLQGIIEENHLPKDNIFIGGFSSGGTLSLLISDFIIEHKEFSFDPKGVFAIDSPVDLEGVHYSCTQAIQRNFAKPAIRESEYLINLFNNNLGNPLDDIAPYEKHSAFTLSTNNISNLQHLIETKVRLYTEPDLLWWQTNRKAKYEELNAYYLKNLFYNLIKEGFKNVEYIESQDKGYRANGDRHPHSWSIIEKEELMHWILDK